MTAAGFLPEPAPRPPGDPSSRHGCRLTERQRGVRPRRGGAGHELISFPPKACRSVVRSRPWDSFIRSGSRESHDAEIAGWSGHLVGADAARSDPADGPRVRGDRSPSGRFALPGPDRGPTGAALRRFSGGRSEWCDITMACLYPCESASEAVDAGRREYRESSRYRGRRNATLAARETPPLFSMSHHYYGANRSMRQPWPSGV